MPPTLAASASLDAVCEPVRMQRKRRVDELAPWPEDVDPRVLARRQRDAEPDLAPWAEAIARELREHAPEPEPAICSILPFLLLGDVQAAWDEALCRSRRVTHILNVGGPSSSSRSTASSLAAEYKQVDAEDTKGYPLLARHWSEAWAFIRDAEQSGGTCLVHCNAGINRSGCVAVAALMLYGSLTLADAVRRCHKQRGVLLTNEGFQRQLVFWAAQVGLLGPDPRSA